MPDSRARLDEDCRPWVVRGGAGSSGGLHRQLKHAENGSETYLRPGLPFGGPCLPKDLRALVHEAQRHDVPTRLLSAVLESNRIRHDGCVRRVLETGAHRIGVLGLSFKDGTNDVRESPAIAVVEALLEHGAHVAIYDRWVSLENLSGANRAYLVAHCPRVAQLLRRSIEEVTGEAETLVIVANDEEYRRAAERRRLGQIVVDLVREQ